MNTIKTDEEYGASIHALLKEIESYLEQPEALLSAEGQERFMYAVLSRGRQIVRSEPHLRDAVVKAFNDYNQIDIDRLKKECSEQVKLLTDMSIFLSEIRGLKLRDKQVRTGLLERAQKLI